MKYFIQCCALYFAAILPAQADDHLFVDIGVRAYHFNRELTASKDLNEDTPGLGMRSVQERTQYMLGAYRNSIRRMSVYALAEYDVVGAGSRDSARIGGVAGLVTGYAVPIAPVFGVRATIPMTETVGITLTAVPSVKTAEFQSYGFIAIQLYIRSY